jgi:hypothetical protein
MVMQRNLPRSLAAAATIAAALALPGCQTSEISGAFTGAQECKGPIVFLLADTSRSTDDERVAGGLYERAGLKVLTETARQCGELFAAPLDGNAVANGEWVIDGEQFRARIGGNEQLGELARVEKARELQPALRQLLRQRASRGSDVLGALQRAALTARALPTDRRKLVVLLSDGAIVVGSRLNLYAEAPQTGGARRLFIARLRRLGELPDLRGFDGVYLAGLGVGVSNRVAAKAIVELWPALITAAGGRLEAADTSLRFP